MHGQPIQGWGNEKNLTLLPLGTSQLEVESCKLLAIQATMLAGLVLFMSCASNDIVRSPWAQHALYLEDTIA